MNKYTRMNWENTPSTATPLTADNLNHMDEGIERATDGAIALETEIATARGGQNSLGARLEKADKSIARKLDSMPFDSEPKNNSPCYLTSGAVYKSINELKCYLTKLGLLVFESYPYEWMYAIKDIRITDDSAIAIGYVKRTSTKNTIVLYLVENGALSTAKLYANVDSDIKGYATYSNSAKTVTMTVNWDEIPYNTDVQFGENYVLCSEWCYGDTRLEYLLDKAKEEMNLNIEIGRASCRERV